VEKRADKMTVGTIEKRRRRTAPAPARPVASGRGWLWAVVQIAVLGAEIFALLFLLAQPAFRPRHVQVTGTKHLTAAQVTDDDCGIGFFAVTGHRHGCQRGLTITRLCYNRAGRSTTATKRPRLCTTFA